MLKNTHTSLKQTYRRLPFALQLFKGHTFSELSSLKDFIDHSGEAIFIAQDKFEKLYNSVVIISDESDDEPKDIYWNYEYHKIHEIFPSFYRHSTFIGLYSFLETRLYSLCDNMQRLKEYKIKLSGGSNIEKSKKYFTLVVGINTEDLNKFWAKLTDYRKIRNCLVHNNGFIKDKRQTWEEIIIRISYLELNSTKIQIADDKFLLNFIELVKQYLSALLNKISVEIDFD